MEGTTDITLKSRGEASKAWWNVLQHFHNISNELSLIFSFSLCFLCILLALSWPRIESSFLSAWSLKQFGLVCLCTPQWWNTCFTWGPLWFLGNDFPFSFGFASMVFFTTTGVSISGFTSLSFSSFLANTNFTSFLGSLLELPSLVYPKPVLSYEDFWEDSTLSSVLVEMRSTLTLA